VTDINKPGMPGCPHCDGDGFVLVPREEHLGAQSIRHPPTYRRCQCMLHRDILANVEKGMPGLTGAAVLKRPSPLMGQHDKNVWITAPKPWFMAHLRHVAIRRPPTWYFKVISDAEAMTAWLASVAIKGQDILDPDAATVSITHLTLDDLVIPPELLIVRLGVKVARNVATPEVLLEALHLREHKRLPTWIWDTPHEPLEEGHICYSPQVGDYVEGWTRHRVEERAAPEATSTTADDPYQDLSIPVKRPGKQTLSSRSRGRGRK